jgi:K+-sensing histidine kinase KdpD
MQAYLDKYLMTSLLANLLSNGVKYSPENSPLDLRVTATATHFCFQVVDQGRGMTEADQARMFDAFYRGKNTGHISGRGLGAGGGQNLPRATPGHPSGRQHPRPGHHGNGLHSQGGLRLLH